MDYMDYMDYLVTKFIHDMLSPLYAVFNAVTYFGDEVAIFVLLAIIYFGVDKKLGEKIGFLVLFSNVINGILKIIIARARPFVYETDFATEALKSKYAGSFSCPSGHSQNAGSMYFLSYKYFDKKAIKVACILLMVLIPLSRMVLGVHYFWDTVFGLTLGIVLAEVFDRLCKKFTFETICLYMSIFMFLIFLLIILPLSFVVNFNADLCKALGGFLGYSIAVLLENKYIKLQKSPKFWVNILRIIICVIIILVIKEGLKFAFNQVATSVVLDFIRYLAMTFGGLLGCAYLFVKTEKFI